jgi:hypothetical protein
VPIREMQVILVQRKLPNGRSQDEVVPIG